jgi:hypothetical protein
VRARSALLRRQRFFSQTSIPPSDWRESLCQDEPPSTYLVGLASRMTSARGTGARTCSRQAPVFAADTRPLSTAKPALPFVGAPRRRLAKLRTSTTHPRLLHRQIESVDDSVNESVGGCGASLLSEVGADLLEVPLGQSGEPIGHLRTSWREPQDRAT